MFYLSQTAKRLARELRLFLEQFENGHVPVECLEAFRKNPWAVLDNRTVITSKRPNILDKRLDMATFDITSRGLPFGRLKSGQLWVDGMVASVDPVEGRFYTKRDDCGRVDIGVFIDGNKAYMLEGHNGALAFDVGRATIVSADHVGCVLLTPNADEVYRLPDGKTMGRISSGLIIHGAVTDPTKPMCVWGENCGKWVAYVQLDDGTIGCCAIMANEVVDDVAVLGKNIALGVKAPDGKYALRIVTVEGTLETWERADREWPVHHLVWLDERILLGRHEGRLFVWDVQRRNIDLKPLEGEVVQGPVRHPDGRVMMIMKRPQDDDRESLVALTPNGGVSLVVGGYSLGSVRYSGVKAILGGAYILMHADDRIVIAELIGGLVSIVYRHSGAELEGFRLTDDRIYVVSQRAGKRYLESYSRRR
ncbi:MAG: hypothetical protein NUV56_01290, partial [Candidatus Uhrbacteria bacterium]|nr:hypothetical protein [Candidatus Uhrbacteria bacterium]